MEYNGMIRFGGKFYAVDLDTLAKFILNHKVDFEFVHGVLDKWHVVFHQYLLDLSDDNDVILVDAIVPKFYDKASDATNALKKWLYEELKTNSSWIVTNPFFESVVTELVPASKKRKEAEPSPKIIGTLRTKKSGEDPFHYWFTFDSEVEALHTLTSINKLHVAFNKESESYFVDVNQINPFIPKDMLNFVKGCTEN